MIDDLADVTSRSFTLVHDASWMAGADSPQVDRVRSLFDSALSVEWLREKCGGDESPHMIDRLRSAKLLCEVRSRPAGVPFVSLVPTEPVHIEAFVSHPRMSEGTATGELEPQAHISEIRRALVPPTAAEIGARAEWYRALGRPWFCLVQEGAQIESFSVRLLDRLTDVSSPDQTLTLLHVHRVNERQTRTK